MMYTRLKIVMIASECAPYAKTGGLADVVGALPKALRALGHEVIVIMPKYASINIQKHMIYPFLSPMGVWMGNTQEWCAVHAATNDGVPMYFIESDKYFNRYGLYNDAGNNDYQDNPHRFGFLTRAGLQLCRDMDFAPDIVHGHDWQTALACAYLKIWHWNDAVLGGAASLLTIHNVGYQGVYGADALDYLGLQWGNFTSEKFEDHGRINFLKGGIVYADMVNTVSPTYSQETRTPEYAYGLAPYLNDKGDTYIGILNGVDYTEWNPAVDTLIPARYTPSDMSGKAVCKEALQRRFNLEVNPDIPIMGVVTRLAEQKGMHLLAGALDSIVTNMVIQVVILGSGDKSLEAYFGALPTRYAGRIGSLIGYNNEMAHWIEAGSDFFIMPSLYEPCGLNQIYSLKYGTLPIVRATGGLDDTVQQYDEASGEGTGFKFWEPSSRAIYYAVGWAVSTYFDRRQHMEQMVYKAMTQNYSWDQSALLYIQAYQKALSHKKGANR